MRKEFNNLDFGPIIPMGESPFGKAPAFPRAGEHPRLLFTGDMIPAIKRILEDPRFAETAEELKKRAETEYDGILGAPFAQGLPDTPAGRRGVHNYDAQGLGVIQAKAFMYALYGDRELAYQAIDAMQNYLLTLNIRFIFCDQCREFGSVMLAAARVYDWCYDAMTDDERLRIRAGVINYVAMGDCGLLQSDDPNFKNYGGVRKMEVGYPPAGQGCFTGHGSEGQILTHYMSGAIAFYDEDDDWWNYCASRYFNYYVPARNEYMRSGCIHQGLSYGPVRQHCDLSAAFLHKVLFGECPHGENTVETVKSFWQHELPNESFWNDGDNWENDMKAVADATLSTISLIAAALWKDSGLLAQRLWKYPNIIPSAASPELIVYASEVIDLVPAADRHEGYSPVLHNGLYAGKMIARRAWDDPTSPAVYMKSGHRSSANHEHKDIGTFQIFHRDMLARDSGIYDSYGSPYSTGTIGHNGVTVFNPAKADSIGGWYSGSQRGISEAADLECWLTRDRYRVAEPEGAAYSVKDGKCEYAYTASNIAPAYDEDVDYLSRRMLSIFTDSEDFPLIFACYDRITATSPAFRKAVLLHAEEEPKIDGNTVTLTHGGGKLVASYLSDSELDVIPLGGEGRNRIINGKQCGVSKFRGDNWHTLWGRVEVVPREGNLTDDILAVMYATGEENETSLAVEKLSGFGIIGATVMSRALLFIKNVACPLDSYEIDVTGEGELTYYVSGLSEGKWRARVGKKSLTVKVAAEEKFARFTAPAGKLIITKA